MSLHDHSLSCHDVELGKIHTVVRYSWMVPVTIFGAGETRSGKYYNAPMELAAESVCNELAVHTLLCEDYFWVN